MSEEKEINKSLREFILNFTDANVNRVLNSWPNRAATPKEDDFIYVAITNQDRQSTNIHEINVAGDEDSIYQPVRIPFQIDCYGPKSLEWATIITTVLRDTAGVDFLDTYGITPLFADEAKNLTGVHLGDDQNISRWMVSGEIQRIAGVTLETETMTEAKVDLIEVYSEYPE